MPHVTKLETNLLELIRRTSVELPGDVRAALEAARRREAPGSNARYAMDLIRRNIELAAANSAPLCQDTGAILFYVRAGGGLCQDDFVEAARRAVRTATRKGFLRQNSVNSLTGANSGTNLGPGSPVVHFQQGKGGETEVRLILKGGGCENVGAQYSLPDDRLGADRDLDGCRKAILDAVWQAQGKGCSPGVVGVCIGGDRATGFEHSKEQFLRKLGDRNPDLSLAALEARIVREANRLGIGPMGFGGRTTLLAAKIGALNRVPASFFVSVSYMCWAFRRQGITLDADGAIRRWLHEKSDEV